MPTINTSSTYIYLKKKILQNFCVCVSFGVVSFNEIENLFKITEVLHINSSHIILVTYAYTYIYIQLYLVMYLVYTSSSPTISLHTNAKCKAWHCFFGCENEIKIQRIIMKNGKKVSTERKERRKKLQGTKK